MDIFLQQLANGLTIGSMFALVAPRLHHGLRGHAPDQLRPRRYGRRLGLRRLDHLHSGDGTGDIVGVGCYHLFAGRGGDGLHRGDS